MGHERAIERNLHIAQSFGNSSVLYSTPLNRLYQRPYAINAVTIEDVQALCAEILTVGSFELVMFPENWAD
jgi:hypothetical protein